MNKEELASAPIEACYQLIGQSMADNIREPWKEAWIEDEVEDNWGKYVGDYITPQGEEKWYNPEFQRKDLSLFHVLLRIRELTKHPEKDAWSKIHFRMTAEGDFKMDVEYPDTPVTV